MSRFTRRAGPLSQRGPALPPASVLPLPAKDFLDRQNRQSGFPRMDPVPFDATKPTAAPPRPVPSVNSANVSQRLLILDTNGIVGQTGAPLLEADPNRRYLEIFNLDVAATVFLGLGQMPGILAGRPLPANSPAYMPAVVPTNAIFAIATVANVTILVLYG